MSPMTKDDDKMTNHKNDKMISDTNEKMTNGKAEVNDSLVNMALK